MEHSITEYFHDPKGPEGHRCGYCKSDDSNISHGMWTHHLTVEDYQDIIDRGWRRSGKYCYKPLMSSTCCPLYTISCQATKFRISKSQKRCANAIAKYLSLGHGGPSPHSGQGAVATQTTQKQESEKKTVRLGEGADPSKPPCRKAKVIRMERKVKRTAAGGGVSSGDKSTPPSVSVPIEKKIVPSGNEKGHTDESNDKTPDFLKVGKDNKKPLESFLSIPKSSVHQLEIKLVRSSPPSDEFKATFKESFALYKKYQMSVHKDKEEDCRESGYTRFLCDSPLIPKKGQEGWPCDYGSYHQQYRIDGKLIAVGVIDILPKCVSSVYVYFDMDDYSFLSLGVYSALREIEMTRKLYVSDTTRRLKYYYMGYYVHSCPKMRYKGNYSPSYLLCPEKYIFMPIDACLPKIDQTKYSRLCETEHPPENVDEWLGKTLVLWQGTVFSFEMLSLITPKAKNAEERVKEYAKLVGPEVSRRMLLYLKL